MAGMTTSCSEDSLPSQRQGKPEGMSDVEFMRKAIEDINQRPERAEEEVEVQHILIKVAGSNKKTAEEKAAEIHTKVRSGEDFAALVDEHSEDPSKTGNKGIFTVSKARAGALVKGFENVAWRLNVNEIGVCPWHERDSSFGYHIIKRIK